LAIEQKMITLFVLFDFSKVIDSDHDLLLRKLSSILFCS